MDKNIPVIIKRRDIFIMLIIPAIDILNGECVRLYKGDYDQSKIYSSKPEEVAKKFESEGARLIHIVDLDAARGGKSNRDTIRRIRSAVSCSLEVGGGIRTEEDVQGLFKLGINRLVLGTLMIEEPEKIEKWVSRFGPVFIGGIDALDGRVKIAGWKDYTGFYDFEVAQRIRRIGIEEIIYTSISKDGTLEGPDIGRTNEIADISGLPVILSGGISSEDDISAVQQKKNPLVKGVIIGKALYENKVSLEQVIKKYQ
jgi:phosphoribosylformimino-5-aminoimidazole carboxamide ribotide isomerase